MRAFFKLGWLLAGALSLAVGNSAVAQGLAPAITVNDSVITQFELSQRERLLEVFRTPGNLSELARTALIEDRLKQQELARFNITLSEERLQSELETFAERAGLSLDQFNGVLAQNGVAEETLRDFVKVGIAWRDYVRRRFQSELSVTESDIDRAIAQRGGSGTTEIDVLLSEIIIPAPPDRAAQAQAEANRISGVTSFAAFEAAARQVSALPSRDNGGRLGWLPISNYPPAIQSLLLSLSPGEVTAPLNITNGVALFQMRDIREASQITSTPTSIEYASYFIAGGKTETTQRTAATLATRVDTCDDLYGVAKGQPTEALQRNSLPPADIPQDIAIELARLDPGEVSYNLTTANGDALIFLMLCNRDASGSGPADRDGVRNQIRSQQLTTQADALLESLKASAVIRP